MSGGVLNLVAIQANAPWSRHARHFNGANVLYADGHAKWKAGAILRQEK